MVSPYDKARSNVQPLPSTLPIVPSHGAVSAQIDKAARHEDTQGQTLRTRSKNYVRYDAGTSRDFFR